MRGHVKTFVILFMNVDVQKNKGMTEKKVDFFSICGSIYSDLILLIRLLRLDTRQSLRNENLISVFIPLPMNTSIYFSDQIRLLNLVIAINL